MENHFVMWSNETQIAMGTISVITYKSESSNKTNFFLFYTLIMLCNCYWMDIVISWLYLLWWTGGGGEGFAFALDCDFYTGQSSRSATFNNDPLVCREDHSFQVKNVEVWKLDSCI